MITFAICAVLAATPGWSAATLPRSPAPGVEQTNGAPPNPPDAAGNALALLDAGLAEAARSDPRWRTEIRAEAGAGTPLPGRYFARGPVLGLLSYRPRTYAELRPDERFQWLRGEEFRRFLSTRLRSRERRVRFAITPEEMRQNRPFLLTVPAP